jgi:hypothetical protein
MEFKKLTVKSISIDAGKRAFENPVFSPVVHRDLRPI